MNPVYLTYAQIAVAVLLMIGILLQQRGGGLSSTFGGSQMEFSSRRGAEKVVFYATVGLAVAFLTLSVARLIFF
jgi:preprotein translocase subunit SecG